MKKSAHYYYVEGYKQAIEALKVKGQVEAVMQQDARPYAVAVAWLEKCLPIISAEKPAA